MEIEGKVALVTGAASGIGRATAIALAAAGAAVVIADIDEMRWLRNCEAIEDAGGKAAFVQTDVTRQEDIERMIAFAEETFGALHILHNNAGINAGWPRFPAGDSRPPGTGRWRSISGPSSAERKPRSRSSGGAAAARSSTARRWPG